MSSDTRATITGWATLAAGGAHLLAAVHHAEGTASHRTLLLAVGVVQLALGGVLLQRPSRTLAATATTLAISSALALGSELLGGHHRLDAAAAVTLGAAGVCLAAAVVGRVRPRIAVTVATLLAVGATGLGPSAIGAIAADDNLPAGCTSPSRRMTLYAEQLPSEGTQVRLGWGLTPSTASIPGPLIEMVEGECLAITVVNDVPAATLQQLREKPSDPLGVSLHVHGVKYRAASDGTFTHGSYVPPGKSRTFVWYAQPRVVAAGKVTSNGTAGTWWYHDHVVGTAHGTGGMKAGLVGGLVVRRPTDPKPDRSYTVVMGPKDELNYRHSSEFCPGGAAAATASDGCFKAVEGERIEFIVFNVGDAFHTFHLHGHNWAANRTGIADTGADTALIDARGIGPSESFGFQIVAGESVGAGHWMLHCHGQAHSDAGMGTDFHVPAADPAATDPAGALPVHSH